MRTSSNEGFTILLFLSFLFSVSLASEAADTITTVQFITENKTIVSAGGGFELGFFSPGTSKNRYLGIWYKKKKTTRTVVWLANRETPITDASGVLKVVDPGILVLFNGFGNIVWSSNTSRSVHNPVAQLLESGNFVLRNANDDNPENFLWQSFDYPVDTLLPGMKMGKNLLVGLDRHLSSWKSDDDPAQGDYTSGINTHGYPQWITVNVTAVTYRAGPWNGLSFSGTHNLKHNNTIFEFNFVFNREEVYYGYKLLNQSVVSRLVLNNNGILNRWIWVDRTQDWIIFHSLPTDNCDNYGSCGAYGSCDIDNSPRCGCLDKFVPRNPKDWDMGDWSNGCVRRIPLACHKGEGFLKYSRVKLPDTQKSWFNKTMTLEECGKMCSENCSCMAYANLDIRGGGTGCLLWFGDLIDIREFSTGGQDIYVRMAASELDVVPGVPRVGSNGKRRDRIIISLALTIGMLLLCPSLTLFVWQKKQRQLKKKVLLALISGHNSTDESQKEDLQLPLLELTTIEKATDNFSINNKLGQGGFGPVYKGRLEDGQEIAVKRLSRTSRQGIDEFKNEVICIAKLQHRNLVKLLGCCTQGEERMLIYEFLPNKSLDSFIFDERRRTLLDWPMRYKIINGIARGLLYLHQDSRLRIIHRDLRASNILLDIEMNPKISDFGMARIFGGNETEQNTERVVGTYGYMSPEYAVDGLFSVKSDVFSFGVLMLEIVSGKRNKGFFHPDHYRNLLGHAWTLHKKDRSIELIDLTSKESCCPPEVLRSIHVGLLCVQQHPEDRPSMSSVVLMLGSDGSLPWPKQPGFFTERNLFEANTSSSKNAPSSTSTNDFSITVLEPR